MYFMHWRDSKKARKNRARVERKPKVRWEVFGLPRALGTRAPTSMEDTRRQVSHMANSRIEQDLPKTRA